VCVGVDIISSSLVIVRHPSLLVVTFRLFLSQIQHGFRTPYKVLLDGNFLHAVTRLKHLNGCEKHVVKLLGGPCRLFVTRCVIDEIRTLAKKNEEMWETFHEAKNFPVAHCPHHHPRGTSSNSSGGGGGDGGGGGRPGRGGQEGITSRSVTPSECLMSLVQEKGNCNHFWIASQDRELRKKLQLYPGMPSLHLTVNGMMLESLSEVDATKITLHKEDLELTKEERKSLKGLSGNPRRVKTNVEFKQNKAKGPNPLSVKKKIQKDTKPNVLNVPNAAISGKKRARKRSRGGSDRKGNEKDDG